MSTSSSTLQLLDKIKEVGTAWLYSWLFLQVPLVYETSVVLSYYSVSFPSLKNTRIAQSWTIYRFERRERSPSHSRSYWKELLYCTVAKHCNKTRGISDDCNGLCCKYRSDWNVTKSVPEILPQILPQMQGTRSNPLRETDNNNLKDNTSICSSYNKINHLNSIEQDVSFLQIGRKYSKMVNSCNTQPIFPTADAIDDAEPFRSEKNPSVLFKHSQSLSPFANRSKCNDKKASSFSSSHISPKMSSANSSKKVLVCKGIADCSKLTDSAYWTGTTGTATAKQPTNTVGGEINQSGTDSFGSEKGNKSGLSRLSEDLHSHCSTLSSTSTKDDDFGQSDFLTGLNGTPQAHYISKSDLDEGGAHSPPDEDSFFVNMSDVEKHRKAKGKEEIGGYHGDEEKDSLPSTSQVDKVSSTASFVKSTSSTYSLTRLSPRPVGTVENFVAGSYQIQPINHSLKPPYSDGRSSLQDDSNSTNPPPKGVTVRTSGKGSVSITSTTAIMESTTSGHKNSQLILPVMLLPLNISEKYRVSIVLPQSFIRKNELVQSKRVLKEKGSSDKEQPQVFPALKRGDHSSPPAVSHVGKTPGSIVYSNSPLFTEGSVLPVPSQAAIDSNIGQGGNGTITIIYFQGEEFAVKKTHYRFMEVDVMARLDHKNILPLLSVMMGEEDPKRSRRFFCYHFLPKMSGDLQSYLNKIGHGGISTLLLKYKDEPEVLQLIVDNTKHIVRSVLDGLDHLHQNNIVHNDVKPSNFLLDMHCTCEGPFMCIHGQRFEVKVGDFDSAIDLPRLQTNVSLVGQLQRSSPIGTPGYRPVEYILITTRTRSDLTDYDTLTAPDIWSVGASMLKIFLSHSGPYTQKHMAFITLCNHKYFPWNKESAAVGKIKKIKLLKSVYPNWTQLWQFVEDCLQVVPRDRPSCRELLKHDFFSS